jgi:hypothetical protein
MARTLLSRMRLARFPSAVLVFAGVALVAAGCTSLPGGVPRAPALTPPEFRTLWDSAEPFADFLDGVEARRDEWHENYLVAVAHHDSRERAEKVPGRYRFLAVAVDDCSDSVSTLPHIARLVETLPGVELRVIDPVRGQALLDRHRTPDGRSATPTLVLLNDDFEEAGCWVERPDALQRWYIEQRATRSAEELLEGKMAWFDENRGVSTLSEIVSLLEGAHHGEPVCAVP